MKLQELFVNKEFFEVAVTHSSYAHSHGVESNEKLEYIGDRVVNLIVSTLLLKNHPLLKEGELAIIQSYCCSTRVLSAIALELGLDKALKLEPGEIRQGSHKNVRNLENVTEAIFGALYLDQGFEKALAFGEQVFMKFVLEVEFLAKDAKSKLQEHIQKTTGKLPIYKVISQSGPAHSPEFEISVEVCGLGSIIMKGKSKKEAEMLAAREFLIKLGLE